MSSKVPRVSRRPYPSFCDDEVDRNTMSGTLYSFASNFRAHKILIAAQYSGFTVTAAENFVLGETNKSEEFLKKFPVGKVPALETSDGKFIFESNAIAYYVGNTQLRGDSISDQAEILQWINFADNEILPLASTWVFSWWGIIPFNKQAIDRAKEDLKTHFQFLDNYLLKKTFLVGERISQADITLCCNMVHLYKEVLYPGFRDPFVNVNRWFKTMVNQPQFTSVLGTVLNCPKERKIDPKKYAEFQQKNQKEVKGSKEKEEKQQKPKKEEKKEKPPKVVDEADLPDETELIIAAESKSKDPFEKFPKGSFNMDEFKRVYSNEDESVSIKYFWEKLDKENYSIWYCEYLFPQELTLVFMSCNLIGGMFQRLDKMRKNAFGSMCLFGEDNNSTISGIWLWRGHDLAFELSEDLQIDYESYSWKKLDPTDPETKKMVIEYLSWSGDFGGKKFNQGKIFK